MQMFKKKLLLVLVVFSLIVSAPVMAQSKESATAAAHRLLVGAEISTFNPDWGCVNGSAFTCWNAHLVGVAALADVNHLWRGLGVEGEARWMHWGGPGDGLVESNYLVGPRYQLYRKMNFAFYGKGLVGKSRITRSFNEGQGSYFTLAPGGTVEYGIAWRMVIRAEYEYQFWPQFQGLPGQPAHGLTPNGFSFGVGYRL
jgi:hypothetical protein